MKFKQKCSETKEKTDLIGSSVHCIIIIHLIIVFQDLSLYLGCIYPCNKVFHIPGHEECRVCNCLRSDSNVSLFNIRHSFFQVLSKLQPHQNGGKPASATKRHARSQGKKKKRQRIVGNKTFAFIIFDYQSKTSITIHTMILILLREAFAYLQKDETDR